MSINNLSISHFKINNGTVFINPRIMKGNPGMLLAHATWCGHCKRFMPTYQNMCKQLNQAGDAFNCLAIESEEFKKDSGKLSEALGIEGYPTMFWVAQDGKIIGQYQGQRDANSILTEVCSVYHHCIQYHG